jgi:class 3 adenylate cyclase
MRAAHVSELREVPNVTSSSPGRAQTRGFLFADLRGYSAYTDRHGDRAAEELLRRFRTLVRREIAAHSGAEVRTEGDSFYVVFDSVSDAVQAGLSVRDAAAEAVDPAPIRVGIGIHAGEVTEGDQGIVSSAVNIAARVCAQAEPGEVLVTDTVRSLTRTLLPIGFASKGRRRLKGIAEPVQLYRVESSPIATGARTTLRSATPRLVGGATLLGIGALVVFLVTRGAASPSTGGPNPTSTAENSSTAPSAAASSAAADANAYPSELEVALLDRLPPGVADSCERADRQEVPELVFPFIASFTVRNEDGTVTRELREIGPPTRLPMVVRAGLSCLTDLTRVVYWQAAKAQEGPDEAFFNLAARRKVEPGSCETDGRARETWAAGAHEGNVMCFTDNEGHSVIEWTFTAANIYAIASRRDGDADALYEWWRDTGRLLGR